MYTSHHTITYIIFYEHISVSMLQVSRNILTRVKFHTEDVKKNSCSSNGKTHTDLCHAEQGYYYSRTSKFARKQRAIATLMITGMGLKNKHKHGTITF